MSSKKILIVSSEFPPQPGGIGNHAYNLAQQLQLNDFSVTVLTDVRSKDGFEEQQFDANLPFKVVRTKRYKIIGFTYLKRIITYKRLVAKSKLVLASGKFSLWLVGLDPFFNKLHAYAVIHGSELNLKGFNKRLTNSALLNFNTIIAVSNYTKSLIAHVKQSNVIVIPNGFNLENSTIKTSKKVPFTTIESPILITVGNVSERKGQLNVIKALPLLIEKYPKIHYHIVGIPTEQNGFMEIAKKLKVESHLTFHGQVSQQKKLQLLKESTIFVMLSNRTQSGDVEGFGIAILEANALGLPAIGSNDSGIVDAISEGASGELVHPTDINGFVQKVAQVSSNYKAYQVGAKEWSSEFRWEVIIKKYLNIFE